MVFPVSDESSDRSSTAVVNYVFIGINVFVFVVLQGFGTNDLFTYQFSTYPEKIRQGDFEMPPEIQRDPDTGIDYVVQPAIPLTPVPVYLTLLTSTFLHANVMHILGNTWFLWIFGANVESYLGHARYLAFYLVCGVLAGLAHVTFTFAYGGNPLIPSLGASGAISGVMGAYLFLYPFHRMRVIVFYFLVQVPAFVAVGSWFLLQLISVIGLLGAGPHAGGPVAYAAHVGGFLSGVLLIKVFGYGRSGTNFPPPRPPEWEDDRYRH